MKIINTFEQSEINWFAGHGIDLTKTMTFTFDGIAPVTFNTDLVSPALQQHAMMFGLTNRVKDTAAIARKDTPTGNVTEDMRRVKVVEMINHLEAGGDVWNMKASARTAPQNPAILAYATAAGISYEAAMTEIANRAIEELSV